MSCDEVYTWLTDHYLFPIDYERGIYHPDSLVHVADIIKGLEVFLEVEDAHAFQFLFETANASEIDVFGWMDGVYRPATREASSKILDCCCDWGADSEWQLEGTNLKETFPFFLFHAEQIDKMINEEVKGYAVTFSITELVAKGKPLNLENSINTDFDPASPTYPLELDLALRAWREISANPQPKTKKGVTTQIEQWLDKNSPGLSEAARKRIGIVANWDKAEKRSRSK